jgi:multiple sugar transport system permease protein
VAFQSKRTLAALLLLVLFAPFLWMVIMSLRPSMDAFDLTLFFTPTLEAYRQLIAGNFCSRLATA